MNEGKKRFDHHAWDARLEQAIDQAIKGLRQQDTIRSDTESTNTNELTQNILELPAIINLQKVFTQHPTLNSNIDSEGASASFNYLLPHVAIEYSLRFFLLYMIDNYREFDGHKATEDLNRLLTDGNNQCLNAVEIQVFSGARFMSPICITPFTYLTRFDADFRAHYNISEELWCRHIEQTDPKHAPNMQKDCSALIRKIRWGPFVRGASILEGSSKRYLDYFGNSVTLDLLSVFNQSALVNHATFFRFEDWMHRLAPSIRRGIDQLTYDTKFDMSMVPMEGETLRQFEECISDWKKFCVSDLDRSRLEIALRRIAGSFSRSGQSTIEDQIVDNAIAMEILFDLRSSELKYKLRTRYARFFGVNGSDRMKRFEDMGKFYDTRSIVVHGPRGKKDAALMKMEHLRNQLAFGRGAAGETFFKILQSGRLPNWDEFVIRC